MGGLQLLAVRRQDELHLLAQALRMLGGQLSPFALHHGAAGCAAALQARLHMRMRSTHLTDAQPTHSCCIVYLRAATQQQ